jgi:23S rRNA (cytosine1962-C5)-methyltransferase
MLLETSQNFNDFELLDTGNGLRLERWGGVVLSRPDPQIIWEKSSPQEWEKVWASFDNRGNNGESGKWKILKPLPNLWIASFDNVKFLLKLSPFKHTGLFAEQAAQWEWMSEKLKVKSEKFKILNLFAYTGGATMVLAKMGFKVTHVDASKPSIVWAKENHKLNNLPADSVRWILDDAVKFVKREIKRGSRYDGIIMDPPAFGHGPTGKTWKFNSDLPDLLSDCVKLLSDNAKFLIINGYATNSSALSLNNLLEDKIKTRGGKIESGELCLKQKFNPVRPERFYGDSRLISTGIFSRWQN